MRRFDVPAGFGLYCAFMHVSVINDCADSNAASRQMARIGSLLGTPATLSFLGVSSYGDIAAAGNLVDILDAHGESPGAVLVNVAPRHGSGKKWENGTPFCFFKYKNTHVFSSFDEHALSLVKSLDLVDQVSLLDIHAVTNKMVREELLSMDEASRIVASQFRSFDFLPRVAAYVISGNEPPSTKVSLDSVPPLVNVAWWVDNFGNVKTTLLPKDAVFTPGTKVSLAGGSEVSMYAQLRDVPTGEAALIIGSSGIGDKRFLELVVQGGNASERFGVRVGDPVLAR